MPLFRLLEDLLQQEHVGVSRVDQLRLDLRPDLKVDERRILKMGFVSVAIYGRFTLLGGIEIGPRLIKSIFMLFRDKLTCFPVNVI